MNSKIVMDVFNLAATISADLKIVITVYQGN